MLNLLFNVPQNYAWSLNFGRRLLEDETKDMDKNRTEHQINTRIYNNAFCGLLRTEYPFEVIAINNQMFLRLVIDNITFQCPSNTVSNILRQEYDTLVKPKVDAYIQMESGKDSQPESAEQITALSEQEAESAQSQETKPEEGLAISTEIVTAKKADPSAESIPVAEALQEEKPSADRAYPPLKTGETLDEPSAKINPPEQKEKIKESAVKEKPVPEYSALDMEKDNGDIGENRKKERSLHHLMMTAPNLDDIIFAPVVKNKKVVEIGAVAVKLSSDPLDNKQDKENATMETEAEAQTLDAPISIVKGKKQESGHVSAEITTDDTKTEHKQESVDFEKEQSEPTANNVPSAPCLELETLPDRTDGETVSDRQKNLKEQHHTHQEQTSDIQPQEKSEDVPEPVESETSEQPSKRMFQPKSQRLTPKSVSSTGLSVSASSEGLTGQMNPKEKKGFLSALFGGEKKKEIEVIVTALNPAPAKKEEDNLKEAEVPVLVKNDVPAQTDNVLAEISGSGVQVQEEDQATPEAIKTESYNHDGGKIFSHIHQVVIKKQFGNSSTGPYRFIFWPLRIIEMQSKKTWADFLVHVTDQNGNETLLCTDGAYKELIVKVAGKEFNVYATWTNGVFDSHVSLYGKTASIYTIEEEVYREEPEDAEHDNFLEQFRLERKGQPKHFIVPFKNNNRGELNIPIVGCVELGGKRYPLERREENTLRYRYNGSDKVIRGHWEKGVFQFLVEDANRFIWEDQNE